MKATALVFLGLLGGALSTCVQQHTIPDQHVYPAGWHLPHLTGGSNTTEWIYDPEWGEGIDVYMLDTGMNCYHYEFEDIYCLQWNDTLVIEQEYPHGTSVAALIAGKEVGVARKASLFNVPVSDKSVASYVWSDVVLAGLAWIESTMDSRPQTKRVVINASVTFDQRPEETDEQHAANTLAIDHKIQDLIALRDVVFVAGIGNSGAASEVLYVPANFENVISVGALAPGKIMSTFSSPHPFIYAPGEQIRSATDFYYTHYTNANLGTSFSSPIVAGIVAAYLSVNSHATTEDVKNWLLAEAHTGDIQSVATQTVTGNNAGAMLKCPIAVSGGGGGGATPVPAGASFTLGCPTAGCPSGYPSACAAASTMYTSAASGSLAHSAGYDSWSSATESPTYGDFEDFCWVVHCSGTLSLTWDGGFEIEQGWDELELNVLNGAQASQQGALLTGSNPDLSAAGTVAGDMMLRFRSDRSVSKRGFKVSWTCA